MTYLQVQGQGALSRAVHVVEEVHTHVSGRVKERGGKSAFTSSGRGKYPVSIGVVSGDCN